jgi:hypothetical protein
LAIRLAAARGLVEKLERVRGVVYPLRGDWGLQIAPYVSKGKPCLQLMLAGRDSAPCRMAYPNCAFGGYPPKDSIHLST